jgi:hypothetical protein
MPLPLSKNPAPAPNPASAPSPQAEATRFRVAPRVVSRAVQGKVLVLDHERDEIQQLNAVGAHIWTLLSSRPATLTEVVEAVALEFEVDPLAASRDVRAFLDDLLARELLVIAPTTPPL